MAIIGELYKIENLIGRESLHVAFDYLKQAADVNSDVHKRIFALPVGAFEKVNLSEKIFALEQVYYTKDRSSCFFESHIDYIDFQLQLSGIEQMEVADKDCFKVKEKYNPKKDLIIYEPYHETSKVVMKKNSLSIYFPEDVHMGLPVFGEKPSLVHKTVVKFPVEDFHVQ